MKFYTIIIVLFVANSGLVAQSKTQQEISNLEQLRFDAMTQKDTLFLAKVLHEDATYAHSNGLVETKSEHLKNISQGHIVYQEMLVEKMAVRIYKKTAVVNGVINVKGLYKDNPFNVRLGYTDVYLKRRKSWKLLAWQSVKL